ncbi:MAG: TRAP transporter large permease subunit, partial [Rhodoferax sp.]|nr:TRAP transporter large permease subunit [Rhodoferax sp.]
LATYLIEITTNKYAIMLLFVALLYVLGMFMETLATVILVTPVVVPVLAQLGINPLHFGIIMVIANEVGLLTPPVGVNLFVASRLTNVSVERLAISVLPYILSMTAVILLIVFCEPISTIIPEWLGFKY